MTFFVVPGEHITVHHFQNRESVLRIMQLLRSN